MAANALPEPWDGQTPIDETVNPGAPPAPLVPPAPVLKGQPQEPWAGQTPIPETGTTTTIDPLTGGNVVVNPNTGEPIKLPPGDPGRDFIYGLSRDYDVAGNLLARGLSSLPQGLPGQQFGQEHLGDLQKAADAYKQSYGGNPPAVSPARDLGTALPAAIVSTMLPGSTGAFVPRLASNAAGGAISNILSNTQPNATAGDILKTGVEGAGLGGGATLATGVGARLAYPAMAQPGSDVRTLMDAGVSPTIGQLGGRALNRLEQGLGSIPIVGDIINWGRAGAVRDFNTGVINNALAPIGETLEAAPGRAAVKEMNDKITAAYQAAVPNAGGTIDQTALQELQDLRTRAATLGGGRDQQFNNMLDQYVNNRIDPNGLMTGQGFKDAESDLGAQGYAYSNDRDADARRMGSLLQEAQGTMRDWLQRVSPQNAADLQAANDAFKLGLRVNRAASRPGEEPGVFSAAQYQAAVAAYARQNRVAGGTALGQDLSDAGRAVLGPTVPDSGTPYRHLATLGGATLLGTEGHIPLSVKAATVAGLGGLGAVYSPYGRSLIANMMASRYPWMQNVATGVRQMSPALAAVAPPGLLGTSP